MYMVQLLLVTTIRIPQVYHETASAGGILQPEVIATYLSPVLGSACVHIYDKAVTLETIWFQ